MEKKGKKKILKKFTFILMIKYLLKYIPVNMKQPNYLFEFLMLNFTFGNILHFH